MNDVGHLRCVWCTEECTSDVQMVNFFSPEIKVPVCKLHIDEHRKVMAFHNHGFDVEEILALPHEQWDDLLKANNIDWNKTDE
jgi:hypothetical protein